MADVSSKLLTQFVACLEDNVLGGGAPATDQDQPPPPVEPVDLLRTAGAPVLKRLVPAVIVLAAVILVVILLVR
jgi:hypothetical protein